MTLAAIEPDIDRYGKYARLCALADWLELAAVSGTTYSQADLSELIDSRSWSTLPTRHFYADGSDYKVGRDKMDPDETARRVFDMLRERILTLGGDYPFSIEGDVIRYAATRYTPYLSLLSICFVHNCDEVPIPAADADHAMESVVATALRDHGLRAVEMGALDRKAVGFAANLAVGAHVVGLRSNPKPLDVSMYCQDDGVDTMAALPWSDRRPGHLVLIGQVTCGKSETWEDKMGEPKAARWRKHLLEPIRPWTFLAVPHHVAAGHLSRLLSEEDGLVLDRLRLARHQSGVTAAERRLIDAVVEVGASEGKAVRTRRARSTV